MTRDPLWARALDAALDGTLLAFALWTLVYEAGLGLQLNLWWPAGIWAVVAVAVIALAVRRGLRASVHDEDSSSPAEPSPTSTAALGLLAAVIVALGLLVALRGSTGILPITLLGIAVLVGGLLRDRRRGPSDPWRPVALGPVPHAVAAVVSVALGVFASFVLRPDADDVYYVNRATWVSEHGFAALRDTMFGPQQLPSTYGGGLPLSSIEPLVGALAHDLGVRAGTLTYLVTTPVFAVLAGWATWRLVRAWAPRRHLLVFGVAVAFMLFTAESVVGRFSVDRIWQGKVVAFMVLMPLVWVHLTRLTRGSSRWSYAVLAASGVAFVGLTPTAPLLAPVMTAAALLAAVLVRSRSVASGAVLFGAAPVVAGLVIALGSSNVGGPTPVPTELTRAFEIIFGPSWLPITLALLGLTLGVRLARGPAATLAACAALASLGALLPGVFALVNSATGAGAIVWRLLIGVPTWVLVALLVTAPVHRRVPAAVLAAVLVVAVVLTGTPLWAHRSGARLTSEPVWKVDHRSLHQVEAVMRLDPPPGPWLLPPRAMMVMPIYTTERFALVPRDFYVSGVQESPARRADRMRLFDAELRGPVMRPARMRALLREFGVGLVCLDSGHHGATRMLAKVYTGEARHVAGLTCYTGQPS